MNTCRAVDLADYIIDKCNKDDMPISNLQLNKILYCIQRHFVKQDTYAFYDDIEAWCFGPVVPDVYYKYGICGVMPIRPPYPIEKVTINLTNEEKAAINKIIEDKRVLSPWTFSDDIQREGGAWAQAFSKKAKTIIPIDLIKEEVEI